VKGSIVVGEQARLNNDGGSTGRVDICVREEVSGCRRNRDLFVVRGDVWGVIGDVGVGRWSRIDGAIVIIRYQISAVILIKGGVVVVDLGVVVFQGCVLETVRSWLIVDKT